MRERLHISSHLNAVPEPGPGRDGGPEELAEVKVEPSARLVAPSRAGADLLCSLYLPSLVPPRRLHTACSLANSNRVAVSRLQRQAYGRQYPLLLVRTDGSTVHIRYKEPKKILMVRCSPPQDHLLRNIVAIICLFEDRNPLLDTPMLPSVTF